MKVIEHCATLGTPGDITLGRLVLLGLREQPPEVQIANQVPPSKSLLRRIVGI